MKRALKMVMVMAAQDVNIGNTTEVHTSEWLIKMINLMFCIFYHNKLLERKTKEK